MSGVDPMHDPRVVDRANDQAADLLDVLKEKVQTEVQDVGTLRKQLTITVPREVISDRISNDYEEIRTDAVLPGFRKGHAPLQLIQKRFAGDVRKTLRTAMIGQSFLAAVEREDFEALGDPLFQIDTKDGPKLVELGEALQTIELPDSGDLKYTCEVEIKPSFELPELKGIEVRAPQVEVTDKMVDEYIARQRKIAGRFEPVEGGKAEEEDMIIADVKLMVGGEVINQEDNVQLGVRPTRLDGIALMDLGTVLKGSAAGDTKTTSCEVPSDYVRTDLRGKQADFEFKVHEIKRLAPVSLEAYIEQMGCENEKDLREAILSEMEAESDRLMRRAQKEQVLEYLVEKTPMDVPEGLSARQTDRAVMRRVIELQQQGTPDDEIEAKIDELRTTARDQVVRDLKLEFIMEKVAGELGVGVTDEELNTQIAMMARLYNRRFDRVRDDLAQRGLLPQLAESVRQDKCCQVLLSDAKFIDEPAAK